MTLISARILQHAQQDQEAVSNQVRDQMNIKSNIDILLAPHNEDNGEPSQDATGVHQGRPQMMKGEQRHVQQDGPHTQAVDSRQQKAAEVKFFNDRSDHA